MLQQLAVGLMYDRFISFAGTLESLPGGHLVAYLGKKSLYLKAEKMIEDYSMLQIADCSVSAFDYLKTVRVL